MLENYLWVYSKSARFQTSFLKFMIRFSSMRLNIFIFSCISILFQSQEWREEKNRNERSNKQHKKPNRFTHNFVPMNSGFWTCTRNEVFVTKNQLILRTFNRNPHFYWINVDLLRAMCIAWDCTLISSGVQLVNHLSVSIDLNEIYSNTRMKSRLYYIVVGLRIYEYQSVEEYHAE